MPEPGIEFDRVWKKFHRGELHDSLRDLIPALTGRLLTRDRSASVGTGEFWALQDVSFSVSPGEAVGIIGPNGAGKSTILKVLTRILTPNRGSVSVRGRVGALVEVAAGFHPDLTGRENIFLQGAVMGMRKAETRARFDRIAAFSGLEDFLDTPVKRYSTGMNARLGFAIAAHLDPDVLIVDEVLAVGDFRFQAKAFARIKELARSGIPVVVVSHQLNKVAELCTSALLMDQGRLIHRGPPAECIGRYLEEPLGDLSDDRDGPVRIRNLRFPEGTQVRSGERLLLTVDVQVGMDGARSVEPLVILLRDTRTQAVLAAVPGEESGLTLDRRPTAVEASLQMNVPSGLYTIETVAWERTAQVPVARGPKALVLVEEGPFFRGDVQLNARMRVAAGVDAACCARATPADPAR